VLSVGRALLLGAGVVLAQQTLAPKSSSANRATGLADQGSRAADPTSSNTVVAAFTAAPRPSGKSSTASTGSSYSVEQVIMTAATFDRLGTNHRHHLAQRRAILRQLTIAGGIVGLVLAAAAPAHADLERTTFGTMPDGRPVGSVTLTNGRACRSR
jgi:hypothetical protein